MRAISIRVLKKVSTRGISMIMANVKVLKMKKIPGAVITRMNQA